MEKKYYVVTADFWDIENAKSEGIFKVPEELTDEEFKHAATANELVFTPEEFKEAINDGDLATDGVVAVRWL